MLIIVDDYIDVGVRFDIEIDYKFDDEISIDEVINEFRDASWCC